MEKINIKLLLLLLAIIASNCSKKISTKNVAYYFCYSHPKNRQDNSEIKHILYTEIKTIENTEQIINEKTFKWFALVSKKCTNNRGCTSDLMHYNTVQKAKAMMNELIEVYKDSVIYKIEKVEFK